MVPPVVFMNLLSKKRLSIVPFGRLNCRRRDERAGRSTTATLSASGWTTHVVVAAAVPQARVDAVLRDGRGEQDGHGDAFESEFILVRDHRPRGLVAVVFVGDDARQRVAQPEVARSSPGGTSQEIARAFGRPSILKGTLCVAPGASI